MEFSQELEDQFRKLGFPNTKEILGTAYSISTLLKTNALAPCSLRENFFLSDTNPRRTADYEFVVRQSESDLSWRIISINAFAVFDTVRSDSGHMLIQRTYHAVDGPLPDTVQMEKDILGLLRLEEIKEKFTLGRKVDPVPRRPRRGR